MTDLEWYGARAYYTFAPKDDGRYQYEERVVIFGVEDQDELHKKAAAEQDQYCADHGFEAYPRIDYYRMDDLVEGEALNDGHEVWSYLFISDLTLSEFVEQRNGPYEDDVIDSDGGDGDGSEVE